ncbi:MAG: ATP-binding cassette domain-containing protein [Staphylococcus equorum]|uniref:ATP-binding cassette domain-containing protein n=1 Tax=Staphylococcus equorum TaxID=246432 RepID=A0AAW7AG29_9STAP|nr:ATP-binding cassette domain-containing protein [Staphylococcus equorum]MDK9842719.1 ATP-binding cassette domain-containing protein [Staphylococcus equorum]MDK9864702.1 ATP-binding cassette domain-containing protein [Staphylococcus equorum]
MTNILDISNLSIKDNSGTKLIHNINLGLKQSKVNVLVGESGSGKSLTAKALVQRVPRTLDMEFDGLRYKNQSVIDIHTLLGKDIGFISQDYTHSFNDHTKLGKQLMAIYRMHYKVKKAVAKQFVIKALQWVDLVPDRVMDRYCFSLSGGQLARVQIASVLMLNPEVIIADEPTSSLDAITGYNVMNLIKHLAEVHQVTLLIITHNLSHVLDFSDWIHVIRHGEIIDSNHVQAFKNHNVKPYSLELFNSRSQLRRENAYD